MWVGYHYLVWNRKKQILKDKYGIEWFTPDECNPDNMFIFRDTVIS